MSLQYRFLNSLEDYKQCIELQRIVWGFEDNLDIVPIPLLVIGRKNGGFLYGAFDENKLAGFVYSILGIYNGKLIHCSHMLAVLPEYQNQSVGYKLKMKQREFALAQGIELITWTYDPFQLKNAFFNIEKLGAIIRNYYPDLYGETSSPLHYGVPTDRMLAEWYLNSDRAKSHADEFHWKGVPMFNLLEDSISQLSWERNAFLIQMPAHYRTIVENDKKAALQLIYKIRDILMRSFEKQFCVKRFLISDPEEKKKYFYYLQRE